MLCSKCGIRQVRQTPGPGRPRTKCSVCSPVSERRRKNAANKRAYAVKAAAARALREAEERKTEYRPDLVCQCDRDYLTVPLEEAHLCPALIEPDRRLAVDLDDYYD